MPYDMTAGLILVTAFLVGVFYCLDALYGERRDRSILFWKSLPVSDRTTVLCKGSIPLVVLPLFCLRTDPRHAADHSDSSHDRVAGARASPCGALQQFEVLPTVVALLYAFIAIALWHAPVYCWLLLVSGWAKRATFLWAVMPFLAIGVFTKIAFGSASFFTFLGNRLGRLVQQGIYRPRKRARPIWTRWRQ